MKKLIIFLSLCLLTSSAYAQNKTLDKIEQSLYGFTYSNETDANRLNRIEEKIYGKASAGQIQARISKLSKDLNADLIGQEIKPKTDTFMDEDDYIALEKEPQEASSMDYPTVNELEKQVFQKEFTTQNLKTRLANLEQKIFKKTYDKDDLSTRVDRLKAELRPQSFMNNGMDQQDNDFYAFPADKMAQNYHLDQYGAPPFDYDAYNQSKKSNVFNSNSNSNSYGYTRSAKPLNLSTIEKKLYHKKFDNESTSQRLDRIESSVFLD